MTHWCTGALAFVISSVVERSLHALRLVEMTERVTTFLSN